MTTAKTEKGTEGAGFPSLSDDPLVILRRPFEDAQVGKLPRVTCRKCSKSEKKVCEDHRKEECRICGNYMTKQHIHLDYVGHAEVTDRLLEADPHWDWRPVAVDIDPSLLAALSAAGPISQELLDALIAISPPRFTRNGSGDPVGLWIYLTVRDAAGEPVTRRGYGSIESGKFDAEKQLIGDALRNAAMRFGVALTLWSKGLLESEDSVDDRKREGRSSQRSGASDGDGDGSGQDQGDQGPPLWEFLGYVDGDEMQAISESLKAMIDAIPSEKRGPVREWCLAREYQRVDDEGEIRAVPLPVRKEDVPHYRETIIAVRDGTDLPPEPEKPEPVAEDPASSGEPELPPAAEKEPDGEPEQTEKTEADALPAGIPADVQDETIAEVKLLKSPQLNDELSKRGLSTAGNLATRGARLTAARLREWSDQHPDGS